MIGVIVFYNKESIDVNSNSCGNQLAACEPPETSLSVSFALNKKLKLKSVCCEKHKKGKRCKRCPCFDLG